MTPAEQRATEVAEGIKNTHLTEAELFEAIHEGKKRKYFRLTRGEEFRKRFPDHETCVDCGCLRDNRILHKCI